MHVCATYPRRTFLVLVALAVLAASAALLHVSPTSPAQARGAVRPLTEPTYRHLLYVSHIVASDAAGVLVSEVTAHTAPIATGGGFDADGAQGAFGAQVARVKIPAGAVPRMPSLELGTQPAAGYAQDRVLRQANDWVTNNAATTLAQLGAWLRERQLSAGHYAFTREVTVASAAGPRARVLYWVALVDGNGRALYGMPVLTDKDPIFLQVTYISLAVADGLPAGWKFSDGGRLTYQILNRQFEPQGAAVWLDVNGAFDEPADAEDPQAGVRCLVDERYSGCTDAGVSVRRLMADTGAAAALVDYVHAVEPKYLPAQTCQLADGTEADCEQAEAAFQYTERIWNCSGLTNRGYLGFRLAMRASRYLAAPTEPLVQFRLVSEQIREAISPTEPFDKFVARSALGGQNPDSVYISPLPGDSSLISRTDPNFSKLVVSPGVLDTSTGEEGMTFAPSHIDLVVGHPSTHEYTLSTSNTNPKNTAKVITPERWASFYVKDPAAIGTLRLSSITHRGPIEISLNGRVIYVGPSQLGGAVRSMVFNSPGNDAFYAACTANADGSSWCGPTHSSQGSSCERACSVDGSCRDICMQRPVPWAYYSGGCSFRWEYATGDGGYTSVAGCGVRSATGAMGATGVDSVHNGSKAFSIASYGATYAATPEVDIRPWLRAGINTLHIKATPYSGWGYTLRLQAEGCPDPISGAALPSPLPWPPVSDYQPDPCAGGQCSGW